MKQKTQWGSKQKTLALRFLSGNSCAAPQSAIGSEKGGFNNQTVNSLQCKHNRIRREKRIHFSQWKVSKCTYVFKQKTEHNL
jgi:hypothetical protein